MFSLCFVLARGIDNAGQMVSLVCREVMHIHGCKQMFSDVHLYLAAVLAQIMQSCQPF